MTFGRTDTQELLDLPTIDGMPDAAHARKYFKFAPGLLPLVPFVSVPMPAPVAGMLWQEDKPIWSASAVTQAWKSAPAIPSLQDSRVHMAALLNALPLPVQAQLWTTRVAVEDALDRGRLDIAREIIETTEIPAELAETRLQILALFP